MGLESLISLLMLLVRDREFESIFLGVIFDISRLSCRFFLRPVADLARLPDLKFTSEVLIPSSNSW